MGVFTSNFMISGESFHDKNLINPCVNKYIWDYPKFSNKHDSENYTYGQRRV